MMNGLYYNYILLTVTQEMIAVFNYQSKLNHFEKNLKIKFLINFNK
jgi:hypothetical protein